MNQQNINKITNSEYDTLISNSLKNSSAKEKSITVGKVVSIENDIVTIDVGLKSEGRIPISEFSRPGQKSEIEVGDQTEVFIDSCKPFFNPENENPSDRNFQKDIQIVNASAQYEFLAGAAATVVSSLE